VLRGAAGFDDDAAHAAPGERHVHDVARLQLDPLGREVVERLPERTRRHERDDANGRRRRHRRIMAHAVVAARARM
jgi:hypothetical protein